MGKAPAFQFYPADWLQDTAVLSLSARGAWIDILCALWRSETRGELTLPLEAWARLLRVSTIDARNTLDELIARKICECVTLGHGDVTLINRRMVREQKQRIDWVKRQKRHRHAEVTPKESRGSHAEVTAYSSSSSSPPLPPQGDFAETENPSPAILEFPTDGPAKTWPLTESLLAEMKADFETVDVLAEARKALAWIKADPSRRKTAKGMRRFLTSWLSRSADRGRAPSPVPNGTQRFAHLRPPGLELPDGYQTEAERERDQRELANLYELEG